MLLLLMKLNQNHLYKIHIEKKNKKSSSKLEASRSAGGKMLPEKCRSQSGVAVDHAQHWQRDRASGVARKLVATADAVIVILAHF